MKLLYCFFYIIYDQIINGETTTSLFSFAGGALGGTLAYMLTIFDGGFFGFIFKCFTAVVFAVLGGLFGFIGKKLGEYLFNHYKSKNKKHEKANIKKS